MLSRDLLHLIDAQHPLDTNKIGPVISTNDFSQQTHPMF